MPVPSGCGTQLFRTPWNLVTFQWILYSRNALLTAGGGKKTQHRSKESDGWEEELWSSVFMVSLAAVKREDKWRAEHEGISPTLSASHRRSSAEHIVIWISLMQPSHPWMKWNMSWSIWDQLTGQSNTWVRWEKEMQLWLWTAMRKCENRNNNKFVLHQA